MKTIVNATPLEVANWKFYPPTDQKKVVTGTITCATVSDDGASILPGQNCFIMVDRSVALAEYKRVIGKDPIVQPKPKKK